MSKYTPLGEFLAKSDSDVIPMSFDEIEKVLGFKLPPSSARREWWSNNGDRHVQTRVWRDAGFKTEAVNVEAGEVVFKRAPEEVEFNESPPPVPKQTVKVRHPLFGCMKGTVKIADGVDISAPADPDWGNKY